MKNLIVFLAVIFLTLSVKAQTALETAVLKELNSYRTKIHLCTLKLDNKLSDVSAHHSKYLSILYSMGKADHTHDEVIDIPNWKEIKFEKRASEFDRLNQGKHLSKGEIQITSATVPEGSSNDIVAKKIIKMFHDSKPHREIMTSDYDTEFDIPIVGISVIKSKIPGSDVYTVTIDFGAEEIN